MQSHHSTRQVEASSIVNTSTYQMTPLLSSTIGRHRDRLHTEHDDILVNDDESGVSLTESLGVSLSDSRNS